MKQSGAYDINQNADFGEKDELSVEPEPHDSLVTPGENEAANSERCASCSKSHNGPEADNLSGSPDGCSIRPCMVCVCGLCACLLFGCGILLGYVLNDVTGLSNSNRATDESVREDVAECIEKEKLQREKEHLDHPETLLKQHNNYSRLLTEANLQTFSQQYENKTSSEEDFIRWATEQLQSFRLDYVDIQRFSANGATDLTDIVLVYPSNGTHRDLQSIPWTGENGHSPFELLSKKSQIQSELVYGNYGTLRDFRLLASRGVNMTGKVLLLRLGKVDSQEKIVYAEQHGVAAVLLFTEQEDQGTIQCRQTVPMVPHMSVGLGLGTDPSCPQQHLTRIPVVPVSCEAARLLLERLPGQQAPDSWATSFNRKPHLGRKSLKPSEWEVRLTTYSPSQSEDLHTVVAGLQGRETPEQIVMVGANRYSAGHRPAISQSGVTTLLTLASHLQDMVDDRWLPRRSLMLCIWGDGVRPGGRGMTEFFQRRRDLTQGHIVAYVDLDRPVEGQGRLHVTSPRGLAEFVTNIVHQEDRYRAHIANSPTQYYQDSLIITDPYSHATDSPYTLLGNLGIPVIHPQLLATGNSSESPYLQYSPAQPATPIAWSRLLDMTRLNARLVLSLLDAAILQYDWLQSINQLESSLEGVIYRAGDHVENATIDSLSQQLAMLSQSGDSLAVFVQQYLDLSHVASVRVINHSLILLQGEIGRVKARLRLVRSCIAHGPHSDIPRHLSAVHQSLVTATHVLQLHGLATR